MSEAKKWNRSVMFPTREDYKCRVLSADFGPSKKGHPMITFEFEIEQPEEVEVAGVPYIVGGQTFKYWLTTGLAPLPEGSSDDAVTANLEKSDKMRGYAEATLVSMGLESGKIDWNNIDTNPLKGKLIFMDLYGDMTEARRDPTAAQIAEAKAKGEEPVGDVKKNPLTGEPLCFYNITLRKIWGMVPGSGTVGNQF